MSLIGPALLWGLGALLIVLIGLGWRYVSRRVHEAAPEACNGHLTQPAAAEATAPTALAPAAAGLPTVSVDRMALGRYRIEGEVGRGAMGKVYLGHDPHLNCAVALKTAMLTREFEGHELVKVRELFLREAEMAGRLRHHDIVAILGAGEDQGVAFIAMEYVKGGDLSQYTVPGKLLPVHDVLKIVARAARALAYAHRQGVVHRDIKPANVLVALETGVVKVADFGIARIADACRTRTGLVLGTPSYMSPEQMAGRRVDGRTDLYSLGVLLFQLLTGALPHASESMGKLMQQIANEPAPDVRTLRPELPPVLADVVALALAKRVELRYADGEQMAVDLTAVADMLTAEAGPIVGESVATSHADDPIQASGTHSNADPRHNLSD